MEVKQIAKTANTIGNKYKIIPPKIYKNGVPAYSPAAGPLYSSDSVEILVKFIKNAIKKIKK